MPPEIRAVGIEGLPEVQAGDDLAAQIMDAAAELVTGKLLGVPVALIKATPTNPWKTPPPAP